MKRLRHALIGLFLLSSVSAPSGLIAPAVAQQVFTPYCVHLGEYSTSSTQRWDVFFCDFGELGWVMWYEPK